MPGAVAIGIAGLAPSPDLGDRTAGATAAEGGGADGVAAGVWAGVLRFGGAVVPGAIAAEGAVALGGCDVPGLAPPPAGGDDGAGDVAAEGDVDVTAVGTCDGAEPGFAFRDAGDGPLGAIAAEGVVGAPGVTDGSGAPFMPGNGLPGWEVGCVVADPGALGCAAPPCGDWV